MVNLADIHGKGWTPNTISLIRNVSQYSPVSGPFSPDPASRLFGIKYEYRQYDGNVSANSCLFGRTTVESWLGIPASGPIEPVHWILMPILNDADPRRNGGRPPKYDPTNREGLALIGRRLFWAEIWPNGWSLNLLDYNPGAGNAVCEKKEPRGQMWQSYTCYFCSDPYPVAYTVSDRITDLDRIVPTEDGLLLKHVSVYICLFTLRTHFCSESSWDARLHNVNDVAEAASTQNSPKSITLSYSGFCQALALLLPTHHALDKSHIFCLSLRI